jgi:hypothetical protein
MSDDQHIKITDRVQDEDGVYAIIARSYYEHLAFECLTKEKPMKTSRETILADLMGCLDLVTRENSPEVNIKIISKHGEPHAILKTWIVEKKDYGKR